MGYWHDDLFFCLGGGIEPANKFVKTVRTIVEEQEVKHYLGTCMYIKPTGDRHCNTNTAQNQSALN